LYSLVILLVKLGWDKSL